MHGASGDHGLRTLSVRPTNRATVKDYFGEIPGPTIRGRVFYLDDDAVAIMGIARQDDEYVLFSEHKDEFEPHLRSIAVMRGIRDVMKMTDDYDYVVTYSEGTADGLLERFGFVDVEHDE